MTATATNETTGDTSEFFLAIAASWIHVARCRVSLINWLGFCGLLFKAQLHPMLFRKAVGYSVGFWAAE